jgi:hypothetical protein
MLVLKMPYATPYFYLLGLLPTDYVGIVHKSLLASDSLTASRSSWQTFSLTVPIVPATEAARLGSSLGAMTGMALS